MMKLKSPLKIARTDMDLIKYLMEDQEFGCMNESHINKGNLT